MGVINDFRSYYNTRIYIVKEKKYYCILHRASHVTFYFELFQVQSVQTNGILGQMSYYWKLRGKHCEFTQFREFIKIVYII